LSVIGSIRISVAFDSKFHASLADRPRFVTFHSSYSATLLAHQFELRSCSETDATDDVDFGDCSLARATSHLRMLSSRSCSSHGQLPGIGHSFYQFSSRLSESKGPERLTGGCKPATHEKFEMKRKLRFL
jgi:hypothetical protein